MLHCAKQSNPYAQIYSTTHPPDSHAPHDASHVRPSQMPTTMSQRHSMTTHPTHAGWAPGPQVHPHPQQPPQSRQSICKNQQPVFSNFTSLFLGIIPFFTDINQYPIYSIQQFTAFFTQLPKRRTTERDCATSVVSAAGATFFAAS